MERYQTHQTEHVNHMFDSIPNIPFQPLQCAHPPIAPTPLSILVRASLRCSVMGVAHSVVTELQFLGNFSYGIAFSEQEWTDKFEPVIEPTNADAPDTQLV